MAPERSRDATVAKAVNKSSAPSTCNSWTATAGGAQTNGAASIIEAKVSMLLDSSQYNFGTTRAKCLTRSDTSRLHCAATILAWVSQVKGDDGKAGKNQRRTEKLRDTEKTPLGHR